MQAISLNNKTPSGALRMTQKCPKRSHLSGHLATLPFSCVGTDCPYAGVRTVHQDQETLHAHTGTMTTLLFHTSRWHPTSARQNPIRPRSPDGTTEGWSWSSSKHITVFIVIGLTSGDYNTTHAPAARVIRQQPCGVAPRAPPNKHPSPSKRHC